MSTIIRISGKPILLAVCLSFILTGVSAQSTTPRVAVVSPVVDGQQSSAVPQTPAAGAASTAQATVAPQGATTLPPAASNVTNPPATTATDDRVCRSNPNPMPGEFVMQCEADGSFSTKQCHGSTGLCYCAHPQKGTIYQETARRGEMEHDCATYWQTKGCKTSAFPMPGEFVMQCEDDGSFSTKQCHGSSGFCYCAHPQEGTIYQETARRGEMQHDCSTYWKTKGTGGSVLDIVRGQNTGAVVVAAIACILMLGIIVFVIYGEARGINIPFMRTEL
ncbi:uncharacterized protein LOC144903518 [Branchiostoma floridae x Branchiostoma belcheri]